MLPESPLNDELQAGRGSRILAQLDRMPLSRAHMLLLVVGGSGYVCGAMDAGVLPLIMSEVSTHFGLGGSSAGLMTTALLIGGSAGAAIAGWCGDRWGRRTVMFCALGVYASASILAACAASFPMLLLCRLIAGVGTGAESAIIAPLIAEFMPARDRGLAIGALAGCFAIGAFAAAALSLVFLQGSADGWRYVQAATALPILLLLWWRQALPESPRWLIERGRLSEAETAVIRLGGGLVSGETDASDTPIANLPQRTNWTVRHLFGRSLTSLTCHVSTLWACITFVYYGVNTWILKILAGSSDGTQSALRGSLLVLAAQVPGYYCSALALDWLGRRWTLVLVLLLCAWASCLLASGMGARHVGACLGLLEFGVAGAFACIYTYTPELYPTALRATGMGWAASFGRLCAALSPIVVGQHLTHGNTLAAFSIVGGICLLGSGVMAAFGRATRALTLEEASGSRSPEPPAHPLG